MSVTRKRNKARAALWPVALIGLATGLIAFALTNRSDVPGPLVGVLGGDRAGQLIDLTGETVEGGPFSRSLSGGSAGWSSLLEALEVG